MYIFVTPLLFKNDREREIEKELNRSFKFFVGQVCSHKIEDVKRVMTLTPINRPKDPPMSPAKIKP